MKRASLISALAMAGALAGCGGDSGTGSMSQANCTPTSGMEGQFVTNALTVPQQRSDYAIDLNGDGKADNQLGNIIGALTAQNLNTQMGVDQAVQMGNVILLLDQKGASLTDDMCNSVTVSVGNMTTSPPKYDGTDTFTVNSGVSGGTFFGKISAGAFSSTPPATATTPTNLTVELPLIAGATPVELDIAGGHLQFTAAAGGLMKGQINGAIKETDVQNKIIPNVAMLLNMKIMQNSGNASTNQQILSIFDTGGTDDPTMPSGCMMGMNGAPSCKGVDGKCGIAGDGIIQVCEVATNSIIKNVLAPDVQMFDSSGNYKPNPMSCTASKSCDSLSLGLGFTAVKASF